MASKGLWNVKYHNDGNNVPDTPSVSQALCHQTTTAFSSDNLTQNAAPNSLISNSTNYQEISDFASNAVINFIGQILLEENVDDETTTYDEDAALRETEISFYNLLGKEYPSSPNLTKFHTPQNDNDTNSTSNNKKEGILENRVSTSSTSEPSSVGADLTSKLSMENLPATKVQKGAEEAMKFLPDSEKLFVGLEPKNMEVHETQKNCVNENKVIYSQTCSKKCAINREPDLSEGRARKQQAVSSDEPEITENLDQFLLFRGKEYVQEVITVQETLKQEMKGKLSEHQVDTMSKIALGMNETGEALMDLKSLLLRCAEAISANDYKEASETIKEIRKRASPKGDAMQRMAYYLVDALEARLVGTGSDIHHEILSRQGTVADFLKAFRIYHAICPFLRATYYFSNQTILNVTRDATKIHIIDFGIHMGFLWPAFLERLTKFGRTPPQIRITGIEFPQKGFRPRKLVEETGRRLSEYAERFNIIVKYQGIASEWDNITIEDLKIKKDEVLVVNCLYRLESLADETIAMNCPRDKVLRMIREINPRIFIHGILNSYYGTPFFTVRFKQVISRCFSFFDIYESTMPRESPERLHIEKNIASPKAINAIACEGSERTDRPETYRQWQARNRRAGFVQLPLDPTIKRKTKHFVRELYHKEFVVNEDNNWLLLGWKGTILFGLSTWVPNENENANRKTK